jgi:hypothetical protein
VGRAAAEEAGRAADARIAPIADRATAIPMAAVRCMKIMAICRRAGMI